MTKFNVGDYVVLNTKSERYKWCLQNYGKWPDNMNVHEGRIYKIIGITYQNELQLQFAGGGQFVAEAMKKIPKKSLPLYKLLYGK